MSYDISHAKSARDLNVLHDYFERSHSNHLAESTILTVNGANTQ